MKRALFLLTLILFLTFSSLNPARAIEGASLYLAPAQGTYFVGSTFDVSIFVNTNGKQINAVQVDLKFSPDKLQVVSPTAGSSFISIWIAQPSYSNTKGTISFQGGIPNPGISTSSGLVSTITFRAKVAGIAEISFLDSCKVLLNDAKGTNVLTSVNKGIYTIAIPPPEGPVVYSSTHPDQNKWYKNNSPAFNWEKSAGVTDFSYSIDNDPQGVPDNLGEGSKTSIAYTDLGDGIWYFHVKAKRGESWGGVSHFPVKIDTTPPADFSIEFESDYKSVEPIISFLTTDALSGMDHYEFKLIFISNSTETEETSFFTEVVSPYKIPKQKSGTYGVIVRAYDKTDNWRDAIEEITITGPTEKIKWFENLIEKGRSIYVLIIILAGLSGFGIFYFRAKKKQQKLKKEFSEVKESLKTLEVLRGRVKEIKDEKELSDNLKTAEGSVEKEIEDVDKYL